MTALAAQNDLQTSFRNAWDTAVAVVPQVLLFLLILIVGWVIARVVASLLHKLLDRLGFDRAVERGRLHGAFKTLTSTPSDLLSRIVYYALLLLALQLAFGVFGPNPISDLIASIVAYLPLVFVAIVIIVVAAAIAAVVKDLVVGALGGTRLGRWLAVAAQIAILALGAIAALTQLGIAVVVTSTVLIAVLATIGGILVVGVGGGLIRPMQRRWERWLESAESLAAEAARERAAARRHAEIEAEHARAVAPAPPEPPAEPAPAAAATVPTPDSALAAAAEAAPEPATAPGPPPAATAPADPDDETQRVPVVDPLSPEWEPPDIRREP